jgi:hypothetical protein
VKVERFAGIVLSLGLCMATGCCHKPTKTPFTGPPGLQPSYVEAGDVLHWVASGQPYQISFFPVDPCESTDNLVNSDGKTDIVCNVMTTAVGYYSYSYVAPGDKRGPQLDTPGEYPMHVAPCTACSGSGGQLKGPSKTKGNAEQARLSTQEIEIYCSDGNPTVYPVNATANTIRFKFNGQTPPQGSTDALFNIVVPANTCSNYQTGATLKTQSASCDLEKTFPFTVSNVFGCDTGSASGTLSPQ